VVKHCN